MYGFGGGDPYFLPFLVRFQTHCTAPLPPLPGTLWGKPPPSNLGWEIQKIMFRRRLGQWKSYTRHIFERMG